MFWKRAPVTHAVVLWILVGLAAAGLAALVGYASLLSHLRRDVVEVVSPKHPENALRQQPSLFGTVVAVEDGAIRIDSKQDFDRVAFDEGTSITSVGGQRRSAADLVPGAVITATGKDLGQGSIGAAAIVILDVR